VKRTIFLWLTMASTLAGSAPAAQYVVSVRSGDDGNPGTREKPFRTIQKAADVMVAGDTCTIREGTYRETVTVTRSGEPDKPIRFVAAPGETVVLDGTEPVSGTWQSFREGIYRVALDGPVEQLFVDRKMMMEARWPNSRFEELWVRDKWAHAMSGSRKDLMICKVLPATGIDWTGAVAALNIGPQYCSFARVVTKHETGSDRFEYELKQRMHDGKDDGPGWANDRFYLFGKLEALDVPGEWYHDAAAKQLYLRCEDDRPPTGRIVEYKRRDLGFELRKCQYVQLHGFRFFGDTFVLNDCHHCLVENCQLLFPTFSRMLDDVGPKDARHSIPTTSVRGDHNTIRKVSVGFSNTRGILVRGRHNVVENCIVHDANWVGAFSYAGILATGRPNPKVHGKEVPEENLNIVRQCTVYGVGNVGILYGRYKNIIEYNHVYDAGRACHDIAAIHTGSPRTAGSVAHHNWVHGSSGLGMRGDDQTRRLTFHHNVIWNCNRGFILKGNHNTCYNNTVLIDPDSPTATGSIVIAKRPEPKKWWTKWETLQVQNVDSLVCNNASYLVAGRNAPLPETDKVFGNVTLPKDLSTVFVNADPEALRSGTFDLRPKAGSPLIDAGRKVAGVTAPFVGKAPDAGAYEFGGENWRAGADWKPEPVPWTMIVELEPGRIGDFYLPLKVREADISRNGLHKLALLQHELWQEEGRIQRRRVLITEREKVEKGSEDWHRITKQIGPLHGQVYAGLKARGPGLLQGDDRLAFEVAMGVKTKPGKRRPALRARPPAGPISVDGKLDAAEWGQTLAGAATSAGKAVIRIGSASDSFAGLGGIAVDGTHLYVAFRCRVDPAKGVSVGEEWGQHDAVELAMATASDAIGPVKVLRGFANGHTESSTEAGATPSVAARATKGVDYAAKILPNGCWTAEWRIPFSSLGIASRAKGEKVLLNLSVRRTSPPAWLMWQSTGGPTWHVEEAGELLLPSESGKRR
jgi:hypothetical protein